MAVRVSTGYAEAILGPSAFENIFLNGVMEIYTGAQPASADAPATGTHVARVTNNGGAFTHGSGANGLQFLQGGRYVAMHPSQLWQLKGITDGIAGWFRLLPNVEQPDVLSTSAIRIDGAIGVVDTLGDFQMFFPSISFNAATAINIGHWWYAVPPLGA